VSLLDDRRQLKENCGGCFVKSDEKETSPEEAKQMSGKFEVYKDKAGEFRFRLKAANGEIILASEGYKQKASALNGIESIKKNAPSDANYERKETKSGGQMFNVLAANKQVIGTSESYTSASSRDGGIESVKKNAPDAVVSDQTD